MVGDDLFRLCRWPQSDDWGGQLFIGRNAPAGAHTVSHMPNISFYRVILSVFPKVVTRYRVSNPNSMVGKVTLIG